MQITNARVVRCAFHLWLTTMDASGRGRPAKRMCATAQQRKAQDPLRIGGNGGWGLRKMIVSGPKQHASGKSRTPLGWDAPWFRRVGFKLWNGSAAAPKIAMER